MVAETLTPSFASSPLHAAEDVLAHLHSLVSTDAACIRRMKESRTSRHLPAFFRAE